MSSDFDQCVPRPRVYNPRIAAQLADHIDLAQPSRKLKRSQYEPQNVGVF
jgi:hypothetical protein